MIGLGGIFAAPKQALSQKEIQSWKPVCDSCDESLVNCALEGGNDYVKPYPGESNNTPCQYCGGPRDQCVY